MRAPLAATVCDQKIRGVVVFPLFLRESLPTLNFVRSGGVCYAGDAVKAGLYPQAKPA
jgi:hypothetical protein